MARHGLLVPEGGPGRGADLARVIDGIGFVQLDSVNTVARAHDMILWARRGQYRPRALDRLLADRALFEQMTHDASAVPMARYPLFRHKFARDRERLPAKLSQWQSHEFLHETERVLAQIAERGPCTTSEAGPEGTAGKGGGWWDWHPSRTALEFLWRTGQIAVTRRDAFRKVYDLTERVIPAEVLGQRVDCVDGAMEWALDRLGFGTHSDLVAFSMIPTYPEGRAWAEAALADGRVEEIAVEGADGRLKPALARPGLLDEAADLPDPPGRVRVLSPFDPMLRDRARAERLFGFAYRIEIFVPEPKRLYGYYVFPVWEGDRAIGRIDMKRAGGTLAVRAFWTEPGVRPGRGRLARLAAELERMARFAGCDGVAYADGWLRQGDGRIRIP
ncbi:hypothetical protein GCM10011392_09250 [Wenxinia marina]|nr:hypothetical protein GCM10011392_09250 [Wenxinia marina]